MERLKEKRDTINDSLHKFETYVNNFVYNNDDANLLQLQIRLQKIEELWNKFEDVQNKIEESSSNSNSDAKNNKKARKAFEDTYFKVVAQAKYFIQQCEATKSEVKPATGNSPTAQVTNSKIQLPVLTLPKFSGEYTKWLLFKDTFISTIHTNDSLTNIEKFRYLRSTLQGDALQIISALETTNENYTVAWNLINNRYENTRVIIHNHMKALFDIPLLTKEAHLNLRQTIDTFQMHVQALKALKEPVEHWNTILIYLLAGKLDNRTRRDWELELGEKKKPTLNEFINFLSNRCQILEMSDKVNKAEVNKPTPQKKVSLVSTAVNTCPMCNKPRHALYRCYKFLALSVQDRIKEVKRLNLCSNCLRSEHRLADCRGRACPECNKQHNSLLHIRESTRGNQEDAAVAVESNGGSTVCCSLNATQTILPTATIKVFANNKWHNVRALLDTGSQSNLITKELCNKLKLKTSQLNLSVSGLNRTISNIKFKCNLNISSSINNYNKPITCLIIENITNNMPTSSVDVLKINIPNDLELADPQFYESNRIEMLLGATVFFDALLEEQISLGKNKPILQNTQFGWLVAGNIPYHSRANTSTLLCTEEDNILYKQVEKFWYIEEPPSTKIFSKEEEECLTFFRETTARNSDGQFVVKMPLKGPTSELGKTQDMAIKRLTSIERKFQLNPDLKANYSKFMSEYEQLGHMTKLQTLQNDAYYLPHHPVLKTDSLTTKLRVVFDGSAQPFKGMSLNQLQMVGPTLQNDLFSILIRFRINSIALTADVEKMYRQIWIDPSQRHLQQIVWRAETDQAIQHYQLNTVTYGQAAASFLAIRCLMQLAEENKDSHLATSTVIENDFYVDDLLTGAENEENAFKLYQEITDILAQATMKLRKWNSNSENLLKRISETNEARNSIVYVCEEAKMKTLGIHWNPRDDVFEYTVNLNSETRIITKRIALSVISQIYDPMGLISPIIIIAKSFIQKLWQHKLSWDDPLNENLYAEWCNFIFCVQQAHKIKIPRFILCENPVLIELHGFSDASEMAYAACVYTRVTNELGKSASHLICAKTKVAPLKSISIPRLELCGALLLTRLITKTKDALKLEVHRTVLWTDSTVVLNWINISPHLLKSFVANRVSEIQSATANDKWQHVPTQYNPADIASRGAYSNTLQEAQLWWSGPQWLAEEETEWPTTYFPNIEIPELKQSSICQVIEETLDLFQRYSNLKKLTRVVSYILRFTNNCLFKAEQSNLREKGPLTASELTTATKILVKRSQQESFPEEISLLTQGEKWGRPTFFLYFFF